MSLIFTIIASSNFIEHVTTLVVSLQELFEVLRGLFYSLFVPVLIFPLISADSALLSTFFLLF